MKYNRKSLYLFLVVTFTFSWIFWVPKALLAQGVISPSTLTNTLETLNLGAFGPMVGAFYLVYKNGGWSSLRNFIKRAVNLNFNKRWLIPTLLLMPAITGGALFIAKTMGAELPVLDLISSPHLIIYWFVFLLFLGGPLQEEFG